MSKLLLRLAIQIQETVDSPKIAHTQLPETLINVLEKQDDIKVGFLSSRSYSLDA